MHSYPDVSVTSFSGVWSLITLLRLQLRSAIRSVSAQMSIPWGRQSNPIETPLHWCSEASVIPCISQENLAVWKSPLCTGKFVPLPWEKASATAMGLLRSSGSGLGRGIGNYAHQCSWTHPLSNRSVGIRPFELYKKHEKIQHNEFCVTQWNTDLPYKWPHDSKGQSNKFQATILPGCNLFHSA